VKELLDVVTRVYERPYPALVGTASRLETVRLALQGKLPTLPDYRDVGHSRTRLRRWRIHMQLI
jgi:hypothetical protein